MLFDHDGGNAQIRGNCHAGSILANFKAGKVQVLVATDIAARGIDIDQLPYVVNFDLPHVSEDYVHRIGRTGRAGSSGVAVSLVCADELKQLKDIQRLIKKLLIRKTVAGFEPTHKLPETQLDTRPFKAKKPKKNNADKPRGRQRQAKGSGGNSARRSANSANNSSNNSSTSHSVNTTAKKPQRNGNKASTQAPVNPWQR